MASVIHEGDRLDENFDTVDCELTWAVSPEHFDFVSLGQSVIPRGRGHYPTGDFDCGCIYASVPVKGADGTLWVYYMGGNGCHTNFRETSLARAYWQPDRFAAIEPKKKERESLITSCKLKFQGEGLEILAEPVDSTKPFLLQAQLHHLWTKEPVCGFQFEESYVTEKEDGWKVIRWKKGLENLTGESGCLKIRFTNLKVWAIQGDICLDGHRLWEGADIDNEGTISI
jgi:hypothetical protein